MFRIETNGETDHLQHNLLGICFLCMYTKDYEHLPNWLKIATFYMGSVL